jgi:hypothetical protein
VIGTKDDGRSFHCSQPERLSAGLSSHTQCTKNRGPGEGLVPWWYMQNPMHVPHASVVDGVIVPGYCIGVHDPFLYIAPPLFRIKPNP